MAIMDGTVPDPVAARRALAALRGWWAPKWWVVMAIMGSPAPLLYTTYVLGASGRLPPLKPLAPAALQAGIAFTIASIVAAWRLDRMVQRAIERAGLRGQATPWDVIRPWSAPGDPPELAAPLSAASRAARLLIAAIVSPAAALLALLLV